MWGALATVERPQRRVSWQTHLDYIDLTTNGGADWDRLMKPLHEAAVTYARESSFIHEWAEARFMAEGEGLEILTMRAYESFMAYAKERNERTAQRMKLPELKDTLRAAFRSIAFSKRTSNKHPNKAIIVGFGQRVDAFDDVANVTVLDAHRPTPTPATTTDRTVH